MTSRLTWTEKAFDNELTSGVMKVISESHIQVSGTVKDTSYTSINYWAANPATIGYSFSGNGLPYANPDMAYENTPNKGMVKLNTLGQFTFTITCPNAYYVGLGTLYVPPHMTLRACGNAKCSDKYVTVKIEEGIPFRTLTYPAPPSKKPRDGPGFYMEPWHGARTQEQILRAKGYPSKNVMPDNFWGKSVPN